MLCTKVKQKCVRVVWAGGNAELTQRSEGGSSWSMEITKALTKVVKVLKFLRRDMGTGFGEIVNALNKEYWQRSCQRQIASWSWR